MSLTPIFHGCVDLGSQLKLDRPAAMKACLKQLIGTRITVTIRAEKSKRSLDQNKWYWGVALRILADEFGYDLHEKESLHYALVEKCFGSRWNEKLRVHVPHARSSQLTTKQFSEYMDWVVRFAALEYSVVIPLPNEVDLSAIEMQVA